ncbi:hypothetical protein M8J77_000964 [Diaphorina citri]|nr:hypothetical protein M8J77_000964 [Diaphorina citri]
MPNGSLKSSNLSRAQYSDGLQICNLSIACYWFFPATLRHVEADNPRDREKNEEGEEEKKEEKEEKKKEEEEEKRKLLKLKYKFVWAMSMVGEEEEEEQGGGEEEKEQEGEEGRSHVGGIVADISDTNDVMTYDRKQAKPSELKWKYLKV